MDLTENETSKTDSELTYLKGRLREQKNSCVRSLYGPLQSPEEDPEQRSKIYKYKGEILLFFFCLVLMLPYIIGLMIGPPYRNIVCTNITLSNPYMMNALSDWLTTVSALGIVYIAAVYLIIVLFATNNWRYLELGCGVQKTNILVLIICPLTALIADIAGSIIIYRTLFFCTIDYQIWRKLYIVSILVMVCSAVYSIMMIPVFLCFSLCRLYNDVDD